MSDTTVKIRAKGCANTGITEDLAREMANNKGRTYTAIVELIVDEIHDPLKGGKKADLVITTIEPVVAEDENVHAAIDEHVRTIQAALYRNRMLNAAGPDDQLPLGEEDGPAPKVADLITQGEALVDRDPDNNVVGLFSHPEAAEPAPV